MLSRLKFSNFKAFGKVQSIPLKPITLIFGPNSSGKSSILQTLLLLKQTLEQSDDPDVVLLLKGSLVNLGSFKELIFKHDKNRVCEITPFFTTDRPILRRFLRNKRVGCGFRFSFDTEKEELCLQELRSYIGGSEDLAFSFISAKRPPDKHVLSRRSITGISRHSRKLYSEPFKLSSINAEHQFFNEVWQKARSQLPNIVEVLKERQKQTKHYIESPDKPSPPRVSDEEDPEELLNKIEERLRVYEDYSLEQFIKDTKAWNKKRFLAIRNFLPHDLSLPRRPRQDFPELRFSPLARKRLVTGSFFFDVTRVMLGLADEIRNILERTAYLGPLREYPERHYIFSGNITSEVGKSGRWLPDILYSNNELVEQVNEWLERSGVEYELKVHAVTDPELSDVFAIRLVDKQTNIGVSLLDVGFGISQVLPILVQSLLSQDSILLIEQPEIHIHPSLQTELGSLFAECINEPQRNQFIIETHSEHLILRLQRLIRNKELDPDKVAVIYVSKTPEGAIAQELKMDDEGDFVDEWPDGFFEESFNEIFG